MRILYLADIRFPLERANGIQTAETCHALASRGHLVTLAIRPDTAHPARDPLDFYGLPAQPLLRIDPTWTVRAAVARRLVYLAAAARRTLVRPRPTVVLTRDLGVADALLRVPRRFRPPVVFESHGFSPVVAREMPRLVTGARAASASKRRRLLARERRVWRRADAYVTITRHLAADLAERFGPRPRVETIPDGVRLPADRTFSPRRREGGETVPVVAYAGHLYPWKGVDVLLRALARLPDVRGLIIGGHPGEPDLSRTRALADTLGVSARVSFTGLVAPSQVAGRLREADVLVLPNIATPISSQYTSPLKLFEYLAASRPIVSSDLPAVREILRDGDNAVLVEPENPEILAAGIARLLDDPTFARRAFDDVAAYGWARRAERLESLLQAAVGMREEGRSTTRHGTRSPDADRAEA